MTILICLIALFVAGAIGGILNTLLSDNRFVLPKKVGSIILPGSIGNIFIGGISAMLSWGLYGPFSAYVIIGGNQDPNMAKIELSLFWLLGGLVVGAGGTRWLTTEVEKRLLKSAVSLAASGKADPEKAMQILKASPAEAFKIAAEQ